MLYIWVLFFWRSIVNERKSGNTSVFGLLSDSYQCVLSSQEAGMLWLVGLGVQRWVSDNSHVRCGRSMVVWGRMCGNRDMYHCFDVCNIKLKKKTPFMVQVDALDKVL